MVASGSREAMYRRAMSLMSQRCTSADTQGENGDLTLIDVKDPPVNVSGPTVFFVRQKRPTPMPPMKVSLKNVEKFQIYLVL